MKYEIVCQKCGTELKVKNVTRYLGKGKGWHAVPVTKVVVEPCTECLSDKEEDE